MDRGRDGRWFIELVKNGMISRQDWWSAPGKDGIACGNSCISPAKVCRAGGGADPKVDSFFSAAKYPEFASCSAEMSEGDAAAYVAGSRIRAALYHATDSAGERGIREEGVNTADASPVVAFAKGHYVAIDPGYARSFGPVALSQKVLIKNPKRFEDFEDFRAWQRSAMLDGIPEKTRALFSTFELLDAGYDGVRTGRDNNGRADSESWLVSHPKQVVTLLKK